MKKNHFTSWELQKLNKVVAVVCCFMYGIIHIILLLFNDSLIVHSLITNLDKIYNWLLNKYFVSQVNWKKLEQMRLVFDRIRFLNNLIGHLTIRPTPPLPAKKYTPLPRNSKFKSFYLYKITPFSMCLDNKRLETQRRVFKRWVNSHLKQVCWFSKFF